jgi:hypothetical protein
MSTQASRANQAKANQPIQATAANQAATAPTSGPVLQTLTAAPKGSATPNIQAAPAQTNQDRLADQNPSLAARQNNILAMLAGSGQTNQDRLADQNPSLAARQNNILAMLAGGGQTNQDRLAAQNPSLAARQNNILAMLAGGSQTNQADNSDSPPPAASAASSSSRPPVTKGDPKPVEDFLTRVLREGGNVAMSATFPHPDGPIPYEPTQEELAISQMRSPDFAELMERLKQLETKKDRG